MRQALEITALIIGAFLVLLVGIVAMALVVGIYALCLGVIIGAPIGAVAGVVFLILKAFGVWA
jgi:hypothetical protein